MNFDIFETGGPRGGRGEWRKQRAAEGAIPRQVSELYVTCNFLVASFRRNRSNKSLALNSRYTRFYSVKRHPLPEISHLYSFSLFQLAILCKHYFQSTCLVGASSFEISSVELTNRKSFATILLAN